MHLGSYFQAIDTRQPFTAIGNEEIHEGTGLAGRDTAALHSALPLLSHQANRQQLRDMMRQGRFGNAQFPLDVADGKAIIPGAKGHDDREITLPPEVLEDLRALPRMFPRGWDKTEDDNLRLFGFADKDAYRKGWKKACDAAGIPYLPAHSAGRHGFGQEMRVRQGVDKKAIEAFGGWSPHGDMVDRTYTHEEDTDEKILAGYRTGLVQAQLATGLKLLPENRE